MSLSFVISVVSIENYTFYCFNIPTILPNLGCQFDLIYHQLRNTPVGSLSEYFSDGMREEKFLEWTTPSSGPNIKRLGKIIVHQPFIHLSLGAATIFLLLMHLLSLLDIRIQSLWTSNTDWRSRIYMARQVIMRHIKKCGQSIFFVLRLSSEKGILCCPPRSVRCNPIK